MSNNELARRRDRQKQGSASFTRTTPVILDRREKVTPQQEQKVEEEKANDTVIPFFRRPGKFNIDGVMKNLADYPGHFVIGVFGKQGVGKSTLLSQFAPQPEKAFSTQSCEQFLSFGHKTEGIDMYLTPERAILLDTESALCWTVLEKALRSETLEGLNPDVWLEMDSIYNLVFLLSVCNVVLVVNDGPEFDLDMLQLLQRAELLKFNIPEYPLLGGQQDMNYYPDIVFVCNKCKSQDFTWEKYMNLQVSISSLFQESQLKTTGLTNLSHVLPSFYNSNGTNVFMLPDQTEQELESFSVLISALRDQVLSSPRKTGKKGQVTEKDWFRNAAKIYEIVRRLDYMNEYIQTVRKLRDS